MVKFAQNYNFIIKYASIFFGKDKNVSPNPFFSHLTYCQLLPFGNSVGQILNAL